MATQRHAFLLFVRVAVAATLMVVSGCTAWRIGEARDHPRLHIENRARDGATFADVATQLAGDDRHDVVLVLAGGNDVTRLRPLAQVRADIDRVVSMAKACAGYVVLMPATGSGTASC